MRAAQSVTPGRFDAGGFALVITSAFCYSFLGIFGKVAYGARLSLLSILSVRFSIGACLFAVLAALSRESRAAAGSLPPGRARGLFLWGVFGFAGQSVLYFLALRSISASLDEVLLYTCPAFVALLLWARSGRRPAAQHLGAVAMALYGTFLCADPLGRHADLAGALLAVLAGFWYAAFMLLLDRLTPGVPDLLAGALIVSGAAAVFDVAAILLGDHRLPETVAAWGAVLGMVLCATVLGFLLFVAGLKRIGPQSASILSTFEPLGTILLAAWLLGERLLPLQWVGAALILGAAIVLAATRKGGERIAADAGSGRAAASPVAPTLGN